MLGSWEDRDRDRSWREKPSHLRVFTAEEGSLPRELAGDPELADAWQGLDELLQRGNPTVDLEQIWTAVETRVQAEKRSRALALAAALMLAVGSAWLVLRLRLG